MSVDLGGVEVVVAEELLDVTNAGGAALEVSVTELLGEEAVSVRVPRKSGPTSKVQKVFDEVARLPRRQQEKIVEVVSAMMTQYEQTSQR